MRFVVNVEKETRVSKTGAIRRQSLREQVREALRVRIVTGDLSPGEVVREATVSEQMGVSRTPLREAMIQLEREGLLVSAPAKGFSVAPLTATEAREFFEMAAGVHAMALLEASPFTAAALVALRQSNDEIARLEDPAEIVRHDSAWHLNLIAGCPNAKVRDLAAWLAGVLQRYDLAWAAAEPEPARTTRGDTTGHKAILDLSESGDIRAAAQALTDHWRSQMNPVVEWLT